jgi:hypothetical protein
LRFDDDRVEPGRSQLAGDVLGCRTLLGHAVAVDGSVDSDQLGE